MADSSRPDRDEVLAAVRALQQGAGRDTFEPIYRRYFPTLRTFFANRTALRDEAEDLAQQTLLRAYQKIGQFRFDTDHASFEAWIRKIGENVWKNADRARRTMGRAVPGQVVELVPGEEADVLADPAAAAPDPRPGPQDEVLDRERTRVLQGALAALPAGMRRCMELRLCDLKYEEIARVMGVGLNTVRTQLFEARKRLQPVLDRYFHGADF